MKMNPKWTHDCNKCKYLGSMFVLSDTLDWYTCGVGFDKTVIARYGDDGPEYWSKPVNIMHSGGDVALKSDGNFVYVGMNMLAEEMLKKETNKC
jgi:hypothetical protein